MLCPICKSSNVELLRGYWTDLPHESSNRRRYAPPDEPDVRQWLGVLAIVAGVYMVATGGVGYGLLIALAGLGWGAWMTAQLHRYRVALAIYDVSVICKAQYHLFVP